MKRKSLLILFVLSVAIFQVSAKNFAFGVKGGLTLSDLSFKGDFAENFTSKNRAGFFVGPMANVDLPLGFNVDAALMYALDKVEYSDLKGSVEDDRHIIEIPINLRWEISIAKVFGVYVAGGPDFAFNLNKGDAIENHIKQSLELEGGDPLLLRNETKPLTMGIGLGAGIILLDHLNIGFNYIFPVDYTYKYVYDGGEGKEFSSKSKRWQVSVAYIF